MGADKPMVKNGRSGVDDNLCYAGCSCHNSKDSRRTATKNAKAKERRQWRRDAETERG